MSEITDWEPIEDSQDWEARYAQQLRLNGRLLAEVNDQAIAAKENFELVRKLQLDLKKQKADSDRQLQAIKADIITTLRAIDLCLMASLSMRHIAAIISNELKRFGDKQISYEDDF